MTNCAALFSDGLDQYGPVPSLNLTCYSITGFGSDAGTTSAIYVGQPVPFSGLCQDAPQSK